MLPLPLRSVVYETKLGAATTLKTAQLSCRPNSNEFLCIGDRHPAKNMSPEFINRHGASRAKCCCPYFRTLLYSVHMCVCVYMCACVHAQACMYGERYIIYTKLCVSACVKTHVEEFVSKFIACNTYLHMHSID